MNRRMFLGRFLGGVGIAALGAGTAKALVHCPEAGQPLLSGVSEVPKEVLDKAEPWPTTHWWERPVEWLGDPLDHDYALSFFMRGAPPYPEAEFVNAMAFYFGSQWPEDVHNKRLMDYRPTLTINMLKGVVDRAIVVSRQRGETIELTEAEWRRVLTNVYRRNRDPQIHYNALQSSRLEMMMLRNSTVLVNKKGQLTDDRPRLTFNRLHELVQEITFGARHESA